MRDLNLSASKLPLLFDCSHIGLDTKILGVASIFEPSVGAIGFARKGVENNIQKEFMKAGGILITS